MIFGRGRMAHCLVKLAALFLLAAWVASSTLADDAALLGTGGSMQLMDEHSTIRMVKETVVAKLRGKDRPTVRCEFIFKNEGAATTVKMGFPSVAWGDAAHPLQRQDLRGFRSWVDGKPILTSFIKAKQHREGSNYRAWYVKTVSFGRGQVRKVVDVFQPDIGGDSGGGRFFVYVLKSGRSWRGPIGEAVIDVDISHLSPYMKFSDARPNVYVRKGNRIVWMLRNFEPKEEISVYFVPDLPKVVIDGQTVGNELYVSEGVLLLAAKEFKRLPGVSLRCKNKSHECYISANGHTIKLRNHSSRATLDGKKTIMLPVNGGWIDGLEGYLPLEAIVKALGGSSRYDKATHTLKLFMTRRSGS